MTKRLIAVAACVAAFAAAATIADAASKHAFSGKLNVRVLQASSSRVIYTGTITVTGVGTGTAVIRVTPAKQPNTFNSVATAFFKTGSISAKGTNTSTTDPATNNATYSGTIKATGGTGKFKGVKGALKLKGSSPGSDPTYGSFTVKGSLTY